MYAKKYKLLPPLAKYSLKFLKYVHKYSEATLLVIMFLYKTGITRVNEAGLRSEQMIK